MSEMLDAMADDAAVEAIELSDLARLINLGQQMLAVGEEARIAAAKLKETEQRYRDLAESQIPDLMAEVGVQSFTLDSGARISIERKLTSSITRANWDAARAWLEANKCDSLIKTELKIDYGKGQMEDARSLADALSENGVKHTLKEYVHPQTLAKFVRDWLEEGDELPECFTVFEVRQAKVSLP